MRYDLSAQFLRILPPDTNFGEAWESLCYDLLCAELKDTGLMRLSPPDLGIDILNRRLHQAYQCKSDERGAFGAISAASSIDSLTTAFKHRKRLGWKQYFFCTNSNYTGTALTKILKIVDSLGLDSSEVDFKGPKYWDDLCSRHFEQVSHRFDYRITITEKQVVESLKEAGYFERYLKEFEMKIRNARFSLVIKNNRTPLEIIIPFSEELTVENCLDAVKSILGISLDWTNFVDIGTSAGPSLSLTVNRIAQGFSQKIADLSLKPGDKLELWVKIIWRDETQKTGMDEQTAYHKQNLTLYCHTILAGRKEMNRVSLTLEERRKITIERADEILQNMIWSGIKRLAV